MAHLVTECRGVEMATGVHKHELKSESAATALRFRATSQDLPQQSESVQLSYGKKLRVDKILVPFEHDYCFFKDGLLRDIEILPYNSFILDDNLYALSEIARQGKKATLIYLDPPYGTGMDFQTRGLQHAYEDKMGPAEYVEFMRRRLYAARSCLSSDGSIFVHIGHQMLAHIKLVMDEIFGQDNFRNLITRRKCSSKNFTRNQFANLHDYILFYSKSGKYKWNQPGIEPEQDWIEREYPKIDKYGRRYKLVPVHAPGHRNGATGKEWKGMLPPDGKHWQYAPEKLDELDMAGDIHWSKNGNPRRKVYYSSDKKNAISDYWPCYRDAHHQSIKITGYPTEKNLSMLKMIVEACTDTGDLVIDPFCGSGTTLQAAAELGRQFIGIDASFVAAEATLTRLRRGTMKMGDFVNRNKCAPTQVQLAFSDRKNTVIADCPLIIDKTIAAMHPTELEQLLEI